MLKSALAASAAILLACSAAHATLEVAETSAGAYWKGVLKVPHGCGTEATHTIRIQIPEGVYGVKPMPKAGWKLDVVTQDYPKPWVSHGREIKSGVREIIWSQGNLPNEFYDEFTFTSAIGADVTTGTTLYFPATQICAKGEQAWVEIPKAGQSAHDLKSPAPGLKILAAKNADEHAGHAMPAPSAQPVQHGATPAAREFRAGGITVSTPWSRATPNSAPVAGGYFKITNTGTASDRLVGGSSDIAGRFEVHEMAMIDNVMKMRHLADGLEIKPGQSVDFKPGSYHVMFLQLKQGLKAGDRVKGTLVFEKAGKIDIEYEVGAMGGASAPASGEHKH